jgi:hypothetical protein
MEESNKRTETPTQETSTQSTNADIQSIEQTVKFGASKDFLMMASAILLLTVGQFFSHPILRWGAISAGLLSIVLPLLVSKLYRMKNFDLNSVVKVLKEAGCEPLVVNDTVRWTSNGKENIVRVIDGCLLQVCREYSLIKKGNLDMNAKAAVTTTNQVRSIKVGVRRESEDNGCLFFSAESLCPSSKVFKQVYAVYLQALDLAEERQGANLKEVVTAPETRRKIGFVIGQTNNEENNN